MLLKRVKLKRNVIDSFTKIDRKTIIFRRVPKINAACFEAPYVIDKRCKYNSDCPIMYTCSIINKENYKNFIYIPTV